MAQRCGVSGLVAGADGCSPETHWPAYIISINIITSIRSLTSTSITIVTLIITIVSISIGRRVPQAGQGEPRKGIPGDPPNCDLTARIIYYTIL